MSFILDLAIVALVAGVLGLLCRRIGLSSVVGYLAAGILIGPYTPPFQLVQDLDRVSMLADLGLLFLVFGIGLGFSVRRMQRLGIGLLVGTALGALLVLAMVRLGAAVLGLTTLQVLFVASVLMVSSSVIISKVLEELGANHTRGGQLALGVTLLEDIVAVVMLTLLSSVAAAGGDGLQEPVWKVITFSTGFAALLFVVVLLAVPSLLRYLKREGNEELIMLIVAGLLLGLGWMAVRLDHSMALAAFILGAIIGSTPQKPEIDRLFSGGRHLFGAVFFAAMGMMFDVTKVGVFWQGMLLLVGAAFILRIPATCLALVLTGNSLRDSISASLTLTPLGEFSFVIAFLGVQTGVMPETFYPAAVGASLLTCVLSPALIRRSESLTDKAMAAIPTPLSNVIAEYHRVLHSIAAFRERSDRWQLIAPAVTRATVLLLLIAGALALVTPAYRFAVKWLGPDLLVHSGTALFFFLCFGVLLLGPIIAAWKNLAIIASGLAETGPEDESETPLSRVVIRRAILLTLCLFGGLWLTAVLPIEEIPLPLLATALLILALLLVLMWRKLMVWHSLIEERLHMELENGSTDAMQAPRWSLDPRSSEGDWGVVVQEVVLPTNSRHAGQTLLDIRVRPNHGCSIVGIDRQGFAINNPSGNEHVYPEDRLLVLGPEKLLPKAIAFLTEVVDRPDWVQQFDDLCTEIITVPEQSVVAGKALRELDLLNLHGVQVGGIRRGASEIISPRADEIICSGDRILLLGTQLQIRRFVERLQLEEK